MDKQLKAEIVDSLSLGDLVNLKRIESGKERINNDCEFFYSSGEEFDDAAPRIATGEEIMEFAKYILSMFKATTEGRTPSELFSIFNVTPDENSKIGFLIDLVPVVTRDDNLICEAMKILGKSSIEIFEFIKNSSSNGLVCVNRESIQTYDDDMRWGPVDEKVFPLSKIVVKIDDLFKTLELLGVELKITGFSDDGKTVGLTLQEYYDSMLKSEVTQDTPYPLCFISDKSIQMDENGLLILGEHKKM